MAENLNKVSAGDPLEIPARAYNLFIDAVKDFLSRRAGRLGGSGHGDSQVVLVRNDSGCDRDQFDILGIDSAVFDTIERQNETQAFSGLTPTVADHTGRFAVLLEPAKAGEVAQERVTGLCVARVAFQSAADAFADVTDGDPAKLTSGPGGTACILWKSASTGDGWAVLLLRGPFADRGLPSNAGKKKNMYLRLNADNDAQDDDPSIVEWSYVRLRGGVT